MPARPPTGLRPDQVPGYGPPAHVVHRGVPAHGLLTARTYRDCAEHAGSQVRHCRQPGQSACSGLLGVTSTRQPDASPVIVICKSCGVMTITPPAGTSKVVTLPTVESVTSMLIPRTYRGRETHQQLPVTASRTRMR